jgi:phage repressor protein C with HTH and peptisase S24 domain
MSDPQRDIRLWMQEQIAGRPHGTKGALAKLLNVRPDAITRMMNTDPKKETREIRAHELVLMREFFAETTESVVASVEVPVMGYLGAGAVVEPDYEQVPPDGLDQVTVPFPLPEEMIAFRVRGDSMRPVYRDGMTIIVYREQKRPLESFYGEEAAVRTEDGRRFIKTITRAPDGLVTLTSWNADPVESVRVVWIGEIFATLPASAARKVERQGGIQGQLRLRA